MIAAAPVIKMSGKATVSRRLASTFSQLRGQAIRIHIILSAGQPLTHILIAVPFTIVLVYIIRALSAGNISAGEAASFLTIMLLLPTPVRVITRAITTWEQMLAAAREIYTFLDTPSEADAGAAQITRAAGKIEFQQVSFQYPNSPAPTLDNITLAISAGETIALVGRSGAGKTTLCNLLPRFHQPQQGGIRIDNTDIRDYTLSSLRRQIAIVTQKPLLFSDSIAMNVAFPDDPAANRAKIHTALQSAAADDFVADLAQGIDTPIGEAGNTLSGGQQQRLALARAFYRNAPIIILDEPTSALDADTENKIKTAMRRLLADRTAIIIAHRFSTINIADRVAVIDNGTLIACDTPATLLKTCPLFTDLYNAQRLAESAA